MNRFALNTLLEPHDVKVIVVSYLNGLVRRIVSPEYRERLSAKILIRELGLKLSVDSVYEIRRHCSNSLRKNEENSENRESYNELKNEVLKRLLRTGALSADQEDLFPKYFELADLRSEQLVQVVNTETLSHLKEARSRGLKTVLISDIYAPQAGESLLKIHGIDRLFDKVYVLDSTGSRTSYDAVFTQILDDLHLSHHQLALLFKDTSIDHTEVKSKGVQFLQLSLSDHSNEKNIEPVKAGKEGYIDIIKSVYRACQSADAPPLSEFIIFFHTFIERLYSSARRSGIRDLFFISREGVYLKRLFDRYQDHCLLSADDRIRTHYLRISRQSALQISYESLDKETFLYLRKRFKNLSLTNFIDNFSFPPEVRSNILTGLNLPNPNDSIEEFFHSEVFESLTRSPIFREAYETNRTAQQQAFLAYVRSFNVDFDSAGMYVVDVGWGGTIQEALYKTLGENHPVTGFYLGLRETYNIQESTKRYGLVFTVLPKPEYSDHILMANTQFYEQLLSANHGSAKGYSETVDNFTIESYDDREKQLFHDYLKGQQDFMMDQFNAMMNSLSLVCYDDELVQRKITGLALRNGLILSKRKLNYISILNRSFIQNIGDNKVGMSYDPASLGNRMLIFRDLLLKPESRFRFLTKLQSTLIEQNKWYARLIPMKLIYYYILINRFVREHILRQSLFKSD